MTHAQLVILFVTDSCFFDLLLHVFFSRGSVTTGILKQKTLSLTAAVCMTGLRRWSSNPASTIISLQSTSVEVLAGEDGMRQKGRSVVIVSPVSASHALHLLSAEPSNSLHLLSACLATLYNCYLQIASVKHCETGSGSPLYLQSASLVTLYNV